MSNFHYCERSRETEIHVSSEEGNQGQNSDTEATNVSSEGNGNNSDSKEQKFWGCVARLVFIAMIIVMISVLVSLFGKGVIGIASLISCLVLFASVSMSLWVSFVLEEDSTCCYLSKRLKSLPKNLPKVAIVSILIIFAIGSLVVLSCDITEDGLDGLTFIFLVLSLILMACIFGACFLCWKVKNNEDARARAIDIMAIASIVGLLLSITTT